MKLPPSETAVPLPPSAIELLERRAGWWWTSAIVTFFSIQAVMWSVALWLTHSDLSHAVLPDYDQRALHWDELVERRAASRALGWICSIEVAETTDFRNQRALELALTAAGGEPIEGAAVRLAYFHQSRAAQRAEVELEPMGSGRYRAQLPLSRSGWWRFDISAERGDERFQDSQTQFLNFSEARR